MNNLLLPLGSVIFLKDNEEPYMIINRLFLQGKKAYDYQIIEVNRPVFEDALLISTRQVESVAHIGYEYPKNDLFNDECIEKTLIQMKRDALRNK